MLELTTPIEKLARVGPRFLARLKKLGIKTVRDLLWHFPARYDDYSEILLISDINDAGQTVSVLGRVADIEMTRSWHRRMAIVNATIEDRSGVIRAVWFNQPYIADTLKEGVFVSLAGKVSSDKNGLYLSSPAYEKITNYKSQITNNYEIQNPNEQNIKYWPLNAGLTHTGRLVPIYPETGGLTSKYLRFLIKPLLTKIKALPDPLPQKLLTKYNFPALALALQAIHFPENIEQTKIAKQRFAFEELLLFQLRALRDHRQLQMLKAPQIKFNKDLVANFVKKLPFELTNDQRVATYEILRDLERPFPMNRLLNGDVGSGKTVVALIAAYQTINTDYQVAFMAPTEILAVQHFRTITEMLSGHLPIKVGLLTGGKAKQWPVDKTETEKVTKKLMHKKIAAGEINIIIGTHAVIQKNVKFSKLGLVIIDEQHRFGVSQRAALVGRGLNADYTQTNAESNLLFEDISYKIRKSVFEVKKKIGLGHKEVIYQRALELELRNNKLDFERERSIDLFYDGKKIGVYQPDFVVENKIIVELKALPFLGNTEKKQIWSYLKGSEYKLALLVNFSAHDVEIYRIIYDKARFSPRGSASSQCGSALLPHLLSMTATPIPRTLALTIYGDLDISLIKEKPQGRQKIITKVVPHNKRGEAHEFIDEQIQQGRQVFVICPRIEVGGEKLDVRDKKPESENKKMSQAKLVWAEVKAVTEEYEKLSKKIFPHRRVAMLHGRMKPKEKDEIMKKFKDGYYDILVSTSVVEVGVDIPNAAIMMIESAERFGLAQLHQFRGRVGRGEHQSYCLLFTSDDSSAASRLRALEKTNDGFELAEADLKIRGPGEFTGTHQSGLPDIAMASLTDLDLIKKARLEARLLLKDDPSLKCYPLLVQRLAEIHRLVHFE